MKYVRLTIFLVTAFFFTVIRGVRSDDVEQPNLELLLQLAAIGDLQSVEKLYQLNKDHRPEAAHYWAHVLFSLDKEKISVDDLGEIRSEIISKNFDNISSKTERARLKELRSKSKLEVISTHFLLTKRPEEALFWLVEYNIQEGKEIEPNSKLPNLVISDQDLAIFEEAIF